MKDRYGVVNAIVREKYEKEYQVPYGYDYICYDAETAVAECKKLNEENTDLIPCHVVERIYDDGYASNNREEVYRSEEFI